MVFAKCVFSGANLKLHDERRMHGDDDEKPINLRFDPRFDLSNCWRMEILFILEKMVLIVIVVLIDGNERIYSIIVSDRLILDYGII